MSETKTNQEQNNNPKREQWFEDFLEKEISLGMWEYMTEEKLPMWAFIRNNVALRMQREKNSYNNVIHSPTKVIDHTIKYFHEHLRTFAELFFKNNGDYDAFFLIPGHYLIHSENNDERLDRITGAFYPLFENNLVFQIPHQGFFFRQIKNISSKDVFFYSSISILARIVALLPISKINAEERTNVHVLAKKAEVISKGVISKEEAINQLNKQLRKRCFYNYFAKKLAKKIPGKKAFLHCGCYLGINAFFIHALHRHGFTVIEPQHGYIGSNHCAYNYPQEIKTIPEVNSVFPDVYLSFGDEWGKKISIPSKIIPVGNKYLEEYVKDIQLDATEDCFDILVVSQGSVTQKMVNVAKVLSKAFPEKNIIFKLHPGEVPFLGRYNDLKNYTNVEIKGFEPIFPLINSAKIIVGYNSTTLFEALAFPNKSIFCFSNPDTVGEKAFSLFDEPEELVKMIRAGRGMVSTGVAEQYWKKNWKENIKQVFLEIEG